MTDYVERKWESLSVGGRNWVRGKALLEEINIYQAISQYKVPLDVLPCGCTTFMHGFGVSWPWGKKSFLGGLTTCGEEWAERTIPFEGEHCKYGACEGINLFAALCGVFQDAENT